MKKIAVLMVIGIMLVSFSTSVLAVSTVQLNVKLMLATKFSSGVWTATPLTKTNVYLVGTIIGSGKTQTMNVSKTDLKGWASFDKIVPGVLDIIKGVTIDKGCNGVYSDVYFYMPVNFKSQKSAVVYITKDGSFLTSLVTDTTLQQLSQQQTSAAQLAAQSTILSKEVIKQAPR
ncbi:MAG: hypothetical protein NT099_07445 [Candidatus Saganbacteria bacterium]|nr:hypothetical protein [Candidatus Saganbacteria bacterium]